MLFNSGKQSDRKGKRIEKVIAILSIAVVLGFIWIWLSSLKAPDQDAMEKIFKRDNSDIVLITDFLLDADYPLISIRGSDFKGGMMFTGANTRNVKIEDDAVVKALNRLFQKQGYREIGKNDNTIYFQKWAMFEENRGIAYSVHKEDKPAIEFLTELERLSENGWYYYKADYNEWRNR